MTNKERLLTLKFIKIIYSLSGNANHIRLHCLQQSKIRYLLEKKLPKPKSKPHLGGKNIKEGCEQRRSVAIKTDRR